MGARGGGRIGRASSVSRKSAAIAAVRCRKEPWRLSASPKYWHGQKLLGEPTGMSERTNKGARDGSTSSFRGQLLTTLDDTEQIKGPRHRQPH